MRTLLSSLLSSLCLGLAGCVLTSGPDCTEACDKVLACEGLDRTFRLACSSVGTNCFDFAGDPVATCAECIDAHSCEELVAGACDNLADGGELCLIDSP